MAKPLERLRHNTLFEHMNEEEFLAVKEKLRERSYPAHSVILEEDKSGEELFLLVEGRVKILRKTKPGEELLLAFQHPGDFFGDLELLDGRPRSSRVVAVDDCIVYTLSKKDFEQLVAESHPFAVRLMQVLSIRLRALNQHFVSELERNSEHTRKELKKLEQLIEAAKTVNSTLELDKLLDVILETALKIVDGDRGTVYLLDEAKHELWSKVYKGPEHIKIQLPLGKGIAGYVGATGDTLNIADAYLDARFNPDFDKRTGYRTKTILCIPMKNKDGKITGVFQLLNKRTGRFTEEDEQIIAAMSVHAAIAVENARLYEQERQKIAMEKELIAAREVQMSLFPKKFPSIPGYQFAATTIPARDVAGDLYDFIIMDDRRIAICVGDVSGKGLPASLLSANLQSTLRDQPLLNYTAKECLQRSNSLLFQSTSADKFVTLFYAILDVGDHSLCFSNAGHDPPYLFSAGSELRRLKAGGIPLGVIEHFPYEEERVPIHPGETLVIYSDGITEAMNHREEQFGQERLEEILRHHQQDSAAALLEQVITAARQHVGPTPQADDITLVIVKRVA